MMAREVLTEIEIGASVETVWKELTDFSAYPAWNPFVKSIEGEAVQGARLSVLVSPPNNKDMRFNPVVREVVENKKFVWQGRVMFPGVFDGEHVFELEPLSATKIRFIHKETFSGVLVPMLWSKLDKDTRQGFINMNNALKARCEGE